MDVLGDGEHVDDVVCVERLLGLVVERILAQQQLHSDRLAERAQHRHFVNGVFLHGRVDARAVKDNSPLVINPFKSNCICNAHVFANVKNSSKYMMYVTR